MSKDWQDIMAVNLNGVFNVTHAFLEHLRRSKGRIINRFGRWCRLGFAQAGPWGLRKAIGLQSGRHWRPAVAFAGASVDRGRQLANAGRARGGSRLAGLARGGWPSLPRPSENTARFKGRKWLML